MIRFDNVSKTYHIRKFSKQVFSNLSFEIKRGESIGICGANGAGKSTLINRYLGEERLLTGPADHRAHRADHDDQLADRICQRVPGEHDR